ncbi:TonB family protein [Granulicella sibirica]|nr:TonB family protein [Granulicella sibirica]
MSRVRAWFSIALFATAHCACRAQTIAPDALPDLKYPPTARAAKVQGDVVVSFRQTLEGRTVDVSPISGPAMLQGVAVENVKAWHFKTRTELAEQPYKVTFHFQLNPPDDGYDESQPVTKALLDGTGQVQVISIFTTGLDRSECPSANDRVPPASVVSGDFVELQRWNEEVRVSSDGSVIWKQGDVSRTGQITPAEAKSLLEQFRIAAVWRLCGSYDQAGLMDGDASSFKVRIGGREKSVGEYGDAAPAIFRDVETAVDVSTNTHQWRHGDPRTESIAEITFEYLPKPGKTKLMDAVHRGDKEAFRAALEAGDKLTDADASGWTPLMYAASSYGNSPLKEIVNAGVNVNARSKRGETALMASAVTGMADEDLLKAGAEVNAINTEDMTALMLLVQRGDPDEIATLLKAGADARARDAKGRTALDYLNAANCGSPIVHEQDPRWMTLGYSKCNALDRDDYQKAKRLLINAGAKATRNAAPPPLPTQSRSGLKLFD